MARPEPTVVLTWKDPDSYKALQICEAECFSYFAVLYEGKPFQLRKIVNTELDTPGNNGNRKYPRTVFSNSGHAFNLAKKLNEYFATTKFTVARMYV
jgi:hypothetical protein